MPAAREAISLLSQVSGYVCSTCCSHHGQMHLPCILAMVHSSCATLPVQTLPTIGRLMLCSLLAWPSTALITASFAPPDTCSDWQQLGGEVNKIMRLTKSWPQQYMKRGTRFVTGIMLLDEDMFHSKRNHQSEKNNNSSMVLDSGLQDTLISHLCHMRSHTPWSKAYCLQLFPLNMPADFMGNPACITLSFPARPGYPPASCSVKALVDISGAVSKLGKDT